MEKTEIILAKQGEEVAEKIVNIGLNMQLDNGIVNFSGQKVVKGINGKEHLLPLDHTAYNIRISELEQFANANESEEQKVRRDAKTAIYVKLLETVTKASEKAIVELEKLYGNDK